jgi:hypothetical protein
LLAASFDNRVGHDCYRLRRSAGWLRSHPDKWGQKHPLRQRSSKGNFFDGG